MQAWVALPADRVDQSDPVLADRVEELGYADIAADVRAGRSAATHWSHFVDALMREWLFGLYRLPARLLDPRAEGTHYASTTCPPHFRATPKTA